jgi:hypothetical protein
MAVTDDNVMKTAAVWRATHDLYYIGTICNGNTNVPLSVYRFSDHERVWGPGYYKDAQDWIDQTSARAVLTALEPSCPG